MALAVIEPPWEAPRAVKDLHRKFFSFASLGALVHGARLGDPSRVWPLITADEVSSAVEAAQAAASMRTAVSMGVPYDDEMSAAARAGFEALHGFDGFGIYLGSRRNTLDKGRLLERKICSILTILNSSETKFAKAKVAEISGDIEHRCWECEDIEEERHAILNSWPAIVSQIARHKADGSRVAVHCQAGVSRSASSVLAWMVTPEAIGGGGLTLVNAVNALRVGRPIVSPNEGFLAALLVYYRAVRAGEEPPLYVNDDDAREEAEAILATMDPEEPEPAAAPSAYEEQAAAVPQAAEAASEARPAPAGASAGDG